MSREIKFRAFVKKLKWMLPVENINFAVKTVEVDLTSGNGDYSEYDFDEIELIQFTGLKDKNGKEIYEGDIVKNLYVSPLDNKEKSHIWVVEYETGMYWLRHINKMKHYDSSLFLKFTRIEVVGNVHENPELLVKECYTQNLTTR